MADIESLIRQIEQSGKDFFWLGEASQSSIEKLESLLGTRLPYSFRQFLSRYGGGGLGGAVISGIEDNDAILEYRGTVYGDTLRCREDYGLPSHLVVVYFDGDDVVWCLDVREFSEDECKVVSFDVYSKTTKPLANNFNEFFAEYLRLRI